MSDPVAVATSPWRDPAIITAWLTGLSVLLGVLLTSGVAAYISIRRYLTENAKANEQIKEKQTEAASEAKALGEAQARAREENALAARQLGVQQQVVQEKIQESVNGNLGLATAKIEQLHDKVAEVTAALAAAPTKGKK